jgi:hypothetical protein
MIICAGVQAATPSNADAILKRAYDNYRSTSSAVSIEGVTTAAPRVNGFAIVANGERSYGAAVIGIDPPYMPPYVLDAVHSEYQDMLTQTLKTRVTVVSIKIYVERSGGQTRCLVGRTDKGTFRIAAADRHPLLMDPSEAEWEAAGCDRLNYTDVREPIK